MGGAPFRGEESIDYLLDLTDVAIDVIAVRTDQAGLLRQKYGAKVSVFGSLDELDCRTYDLIVITPCWIATGFYKPLKAFRRDQPRS